MLSSAKPLFKTIIIRYPPQRMYKNTIDMSADNKSKSSGLPPCAICHAKIAIYRCPRCHTCTCSLECCRAHKMGVNSKDGSMSKSNEAVVCNGKRDRTQFCSLKGFTDSQLASDYHFLEDVLKVSESTKRMYQGIVKGDSAMPIMTSGPSAKRTKVSNNSSDRVELGSIFDKDKLPAHPLLQAKEGKSIVDVIASGVMADDNMNSDAKQPSRPGIVNELLVNTNNKPQTSKPTQQEQNREKVDPLKRQAELKGVNLLRMPSGMERRKSNTTKFNKKKGKITWKVELCFHHPRKNASTCNGVAGGAESPLSTATKKISKTLPRFLKVESEVLESCTLSQELKKHLDVHPGNSTRRSQLRVFTTVPRESLLFYMKRLPCPSSSPQYYKLDPNVTLTDVLKDKTIIEFPTIDIVMEDDKGCLPLFIGEIN